MPRIFTTGILVLVLLLSSMAFATALNDIYLNAPAMAGYDRVLVLDPQQTYTGGIIIFNEKIAVWGNGATIDLQGNGIIAIGKGLLDIDGCNLINGGAAVNVADEVRTRVSNCVFYNNDTGIQHYSYMAPLKVYNSVFMNNQGNGVLTFEENLTYMEYNVAYNNSGGHFQAGCGS